MLPIELGGRHFPGSSCCLGKTYLRNVSQPLVISAPQSRKVLISDKKSRWECFSFRPRAPSSLETDPKPRFGLVKCN